MSQNDDLRNEPVDDAVQAVVDRVLSYQSGAELDVVRQELESGLADIDADMPEGWVQRTAQQISDAEQPGD